MPESPRRLVVSNLRVEVRSSGAPVVDDVAFSLDAGRMLGLVGESGSGKTTVGLALLAYARRGLRIADGQVQIEGEDILRLDRAAVRARRGATVAYVPQDPASALNPALTVGAQLTEALKLHPGTHKDQRAGRITEVLEQVRLTSNVLGSYPHQLSGGQQQRVLLAMAFLLSPAVIVLDEPTTGLDVSTQRHVLETVRGLCAMSGVAAVFVSHDLAVVAEMVDEVAVMYAGRIVEHGPSADTFGLPIHPYTRGLLRAIPSPVRSHALVGMDGSPPSPGTLYSGCAFASRCEFAQEDCRRTEPALDAVGPGHTVRCLRAAEIRALARPADHDAFDWNGARADAEPLLSVEGVSASYGTKRVLDPSTLSLAQGRCVAIVGESGSGKTTLARCIVGLHHKCEGTIRFAGAPLERRARDRSPTALRSIQYVFQNPYGSLNPRRTVGQIVEQPLRQFFDLDRHARAERVRFALESAALDPAYAGRAPAELSGGQRQRVAIARALVVEPAVLVCDEITSALDVSVQAAIVELLRELQTERNLALLFITHNLALVRSIAQEIVVMADGRIVEAGATPDVLDAPADAYTQRLLADVPRIDTGAGASDVQALGSSPNGSVVR